MESGSWLAPRFALITCTQRPADRYVFAASLPVEANPQDPLILITLEIRQPWRPESRLVAAITDVLSQRYSTIRRSTNPLQSFELSLKNINEELMGLAEAGETEWIGRVNGVIALIIGNEVHVAQTGQATAYLFRQQKISQILERQDIVDPHPLTTFANIVSGYTNAGDRLVLANNDLFTLVPLEGIRAAVTDETPWQGVQSLARALKRTRVLSVTTAVIGVEQARTWEDVGLEPIVIDLDEFNRSWAKKLWQSARPLLAAGRTKASAALRRAKETAGPKARQLWQKRPRPKLRSIAPRVSATSETPTEAIAVWQTVLANGEAGLTTTIAAPLARLANPLQIPLRRLDAWSASLGPRLRGLATGRNRWGLVIVAILLISVAARSVTVRRQQALGNAQRNQNESRLTTARDEIGRLQTAINLKETDEAEALIKSAQRALDAVAQPTAEQQAKLATLKTSLSTAADTLHHVVRLTAGSTLAVPTADRLLMSGDTTILTGVNGSGALHLMKKGTTSPSSLTEGKTVSRLIFDRDRAQYLVIQNDGAVATLPVEGGDAFGSLPITSGVVPSGPARTFGRNLYVLDNSQGTLWKFAASGGGFASAAGLVTDESLKTARDLAIDGSIYVLRADSTVAKYNRGKLDATFALKNTPSTNQFDQIFTASGSDVIYLVDLKAGQIAVYDVTGLFGKLLVLPQNNLLGVEIDVTTKKAFVLTAGLLTEYSL